MSWSLWALEVEGEAVLDGEGGTLEDVEGEVVQDRADKGGGDVIVFMEDAKMVWGCARGVRCLLHHSSHCLLHCRRNIFFQD